MPAGCPPATSSHCWPEGATTASRSFTSVHSFPVFSVAIVFASTTVAKSSRLQPTTTEPSRACAVGAMRQRSIKFGSRSFRART